MVNGMLYLALLWGSFRSNYVAGPGSKSSSRLRGGLLPHLQTWKHEREISISPPVHGWPIQPKQACPLWAFVLFPLLYENAGKRVNYKQLTRFWHLAGRKIEEYSYKYPTILTFKSLYLPKHLLFEPCYYLFIRQQLPMDNSSPVNNSTIENEYDQQDTRSIAHVANECLFPATSDKASGRKRLSRACDRCRVRKVKVITFPLLIDLTKNSLQALTFSGHLSEYG